MAIYKIPQGKKLNDKNYDLDNLMKTVGADSINSKDEKLVEKAGRSYSDIYVFIDPYAHEIGDELILRVFKDEKSALDEYYLSCEEI